MDFAALSRGALIQPIVPQSDASGLVKRVWLHLYTEGGHWTVTELREKLRFGRDLKMHLAQMVDRGLIRQRKATDLDGREALQFSVDRQCKVPRGVVIAEIEELLQLVAMARGRQ